jgi:hypothetical protein
MKWYKEQTFKMALIAWTTMATFFNIVVWIIDGTPDLSVLLFFLGGYALLISTTYIFRNVK